MAGTRPENTIMETRMDLMASQSNRLRLGRFLNTSFTTKSNTPLLNLPPHAFTYTRNNSGAISMNVSFKGWQTPYRAWDEWVLQMEPRYGPMWKILGIFDAIKNSTLQICPHKDVVLALTRKWFPKTSTFVFKWGEATITLEDICVLGGYPVIGESVLLPYDANTQEMDNVDRRLIDARRFIRESGVKKVPLNKWIDLFRGNVNGFGELEHVGFLVFWLSKYVFPKSKGANVVGKHVHSIAIRLAMGFRVALAPAVLASIYRDLTFLEDRISAAGVLNQDFLNEVTDLWGPMHLVQIWAWERFPALKPRSNPIVPGQQIMARWDGCRYPRYEPALDVDLVIENRPIGFLWRPYDSFLEHHDLIRNLYKDREQLIQECSQLSDDAESLVKFVRPSELVGVDCIEQYLPHRVARQFGFDQDVPNRVSRFNQNEVMAWANYCRPVTDRELYIPSRLVKTDVTVRYVQWWERSRSAVGAGP